MIPVFSGRNAPPEEEAKAEEVKRRIEDVSEQSSQVLTQSLGADFSSFDGAVVIGGQNTNAVYNQLITLREFEAVKIDNDDVARIQFVDESPVLVLAGYRDQDTIDIVERELDNGIVREFVNKFEDEPTEEIPEPSDPVIPLPPEDPPEEVETPQEIIVRPPQKFEAILTVDYVIRFSGVVEQKSDMEAGDTAVGGRASGTVGASLGVDEDVFSFSGQLVDVQAEQDLVLIINDEEYIFDSGANKIKKASDFLGDIGGREEVDHIAQDLRKGGLRPDKPDNKPELPVVGEVSQRVLIISALILVAVYLFTRESPEVVLRGD